MSTVSIVVPALNEAANLPRLVERIEQALTSAEDWELIVVDDGSTDETLAVLKSLAESNPRVRYLSLTRNFGHQAALKAGLDHAYGECVISMDADLQHPPELAPEMLRAWRSGYEVVNMVRIGTALPWLKRTTSRLFYALTNSISDYRIEPGSSDFRLLDRRVVDVIRRIDEKNLFLRGLIPWLGFRQINLPYEPNQRAQGDVKYGLRRMMRLAVQGITSSSLRPLHLATICGCAMSVAAGVYAAYALWVRFVAGTALPGWTSVLISVLLIGGVQLLMFGVLGEYLGRTLIETKGRPTYVLREHNLPQVRSAAKG